MWNIWFTPDCSRLVMCSFLRSTIWFGSYTFFVFEHFERAIHRDVLHETACPNMLKDKKVVCNEGHAA